MATMALVYTETTIESGSIGVIKINLSYAQK